jgi:hypothetical protein
MTALTVVTGIVSCLTACFLMAIFVGKAIARTGDGDPVSPQVISARAKEPAPKAAELADS